MKAVRFPSDGSLEIRKSLWGRGDFFVEIGEKCVNYRALSLSCARPGPFVHYGRGGVDLLIQGAPTGIINGGGADFFGKTALLGKLSTGRCGI